MNLLAACSTLKKPLVGVETQRFGFPAHAADACRTGVVGGDGKVDPMVGCEVGIVEVGVPQVGQIFDAGMDVVLNVADIGDTDS